MLVKLVVMDTHSTILVLMIIRNPTTTTFASTMLPLDPRRKLLDVPRGYIIVVGIFAIPYSFTKIHWIILNKKNYNMDVHVWIFEATIKTNGETLDEEITNLFNFTFKGNASY